MIRSERGNLWDYEKTHYLVIPTNIGWTKDGKNVMGRGLALQAAKRYPYLAKWYGLWCQERKERTPVLVYREGPLILFPVKPLDQAHPSFSWKKKADLGLIERSAKELAAVKVDRPVAVSMVGCGNGGLEMSLVRPILDRHLSDERFTLIIYEAQ